MLKELAIRFFSAFTTPEHIKFREQEREAIVEARKNIRLSSRSLVQKIKEAEKIKPIVMQESAEQLKRNDSLMKDFLAAIPSEIDYFNFGQSLHSNKKWRIKE